MLIQEADIGLGAQRDVVLISPGLTATVLLLFLRSSLASSLQQLLELKSQQRPSESSPGLGRWGGGVHSAGRVGARTPAPRLAPSRRRRPHAPAAPGRRPSPAAAGAAAEAHRVRSPRRRHRRPRSGSLPRPPRPREPAAETRVSPRPLPFPLPLAWAQPHSHLPLGFRLLHRWSHTCAMPGRKTTPHLNSNQTATNCRRRLATARAPDRVPGQTSSSASVGGRRSLSELSGEALWVTGGLQACAEDSSRAEQGVLPRMFPGGCCALRWPGALPCKRGSRGYPGPQSRSRQD